MKASAENITAIIKEMGGEEEVVQGNGYCYFSGGDASDWYTSSVPVNKVSDLSIGQWINTYLEYKNKDILEDIIQDLCVHKSRQKHTDRVGFELTQKLIEKVKKHFGVI